MKLKSANLLVSILVTIFANDFAIRNNNTKHYSDFYFVRSREKSTISFFLKMIIEGAARNVAPLSKVLYKKEYKKEIKNVPGQKNNND